MARTESTWEEVNGSYLKTQWAEGRDILINGTNKYLNFGTISGSSGYGFRDNGGTMQVKNSGGSWANFSAGGGSGITRSISSINTNTAAGSTASTDYEYICTGPLTVTLPTAIGNTNEYTVNRVSGLITVDTTGGQTILGSATATLTINNMSLTFVSDNANWRVI